MNHPNVPPTLPAAVRAATYIEARIRAADPSRAEAVAAVRRRSAARLNMELKRSRRPPATILTIDNGRDFENRHIEVDR